MAFAYRRTRRHQRLTHVIAFAYRCDDGAKEVMFGVTSNISAAGMCMYSDALLEVGKTIEFRSSLPVPFQKAAVRWTRKDVGNLYRIGVKFIA